jgi:hypothetical protein
VGRDSSVGIATRYDWTVWESNSRGGKIFHTRPDRPWGPPNLLYMGNRVSHGGKGGRGVMLTTNTHPAPKLKK